MRIFVYITVLPTSMINMNFRVRYWIPRNWDYTMLWVDICVSGVGRTEPSTSAKAANVLNCWALSPPQKLHVGSSEHFAGCDTGQLREFYHDGKLFSYPLLLKKLMAHCLYNIHKGSCGSWIQVTHTGYLCLLPKSVRHSVTFKL